MPTFVDIRVSISKETVNEYGLKEWLKIDLGANFIEGETPMQAFLSTKKEVDAMKDIIPEVPTRQSDKKTNGDEHIIAAINACTHIELPDGLKSFQIMAAQSKVTQQAFNKKLAQLQIKPKGKQKVKLP